LERARLPTEEAAEPVLQRALGRERCSRAASHSAFDYEWIDMLVEIEFSQNGYRLQLITAWDRRRRNAALILPRGAC
jgi:hypothetical protein